LLLPRRYGYTLSMGIWDRLGNVIKSYINDYGEDVFHGKSPRGRFRADDPDLDAAYEELDEFLETGENKKKTSEREEAARPLPPDELHKDFTELGLSHEASFGECRAAYKKLLKIHHPDKHSTHPDNMKKATEKSARVNAAYKRIEEWFRNTK